MDVAKLITAKNNKKSTASTNVMIGMSRGRQWVKVILSNPTPKAMIKVYIKVFSNPALSKLLVNLLLVK